MSAISSATDSAATLVHRPRELPQPPVSTATDGDGSATTGGAGGASATGGQPKSGGVGGTATGGVNLQA